MKGNEGEDMSGDTLPATNIAPEYRPSQKDNSGKWWFSKGNALISGKSGLVKYNNLARIVDFWVNHHGIMRS